MVSNRPIFVVGCPRSGTTLLTLMLHAHSRIAMPPETRFLIPVFRGAAAFGDLTVPANRDRLALAIVRGGGFRDLGLNRAETRKAIVDGPPTIGSAVGTVFRCYAARFDKVRWGDKKPNHFQSMDAIRAMFPDAQFVHLIRDGRDTVASLKRVRWWSHGIYQAIALWTHAIATGRRAARTLPADTFYELKYEDLIADSRGELQKLCAFLGEEFEESMLEPHKVASQAVPARKTWHENTWLAVSDKSVGGYAEVLDPWELRLMEFVAGRMLRRLGYDVPVRSTPPSPVKVARYLATTVNRRLRARFAALRERRIARTAGPMEDRGVAAATPPAAASP